MSGLTFQTDPVVVWVLGDRVKRLVGTNAAYREWVYETAASILNYTLKAGVRCEA